MPTNFNSIGYLTPVDGVSPFAPVNGVGLADSTGSGLYPNGVPEMFFGLNRIVEFEIFFFASTEPQSNAFLWWAEDTFQPTQLIFFEDLGGGSTLLTSIIQTSGTTNASLSIPFTIEPYTWYHAHLRVEDTANPTYTFSLGRRGTTALGKLAAKDTFPYGANETNGGWQESTVVTSSSGGMRPFGFNSFQPGNRGVAFGGRTPNVGNGFEPGFNWPGGFCEMRAWGSIRSDADIELDAGRFIRGRDGTADDAEAVLRPGLRHCFRFNEQVGTAVAAIQDQGFGGVPQPATPYTPWQFLGSADVAGLATHPFQPLGGSIVPIDEEDQRIILDSFAGDTTVTAVREIDEEDRTSSLAIISDLNTAFEINATDSLLDLTTFAALTIELDRIVNIEDSSVLHGAGDVASVSLGAQIFTLDEASFVAVVDETSFAGSVFSEAASDTAAITDDSVIITAFVVSEEDTAASADSVTEVATITENEEDNAAVAADEGTFSKISFLNPEDSNGTLEIVDSERDVFFTLQWPPVGINFIQLALDDDAFGNADQLAVAYNRAAQDFTISQDDLILEANGQFSVEQTSFTISQDLAAIVTAFATAAADDQLPFEFVIVERIATLDPQADALVSADEATVVAAFAVELGGTGGDSLVAISQAVVERKTFLDPADIVAIFSAFGGINATYTLAEQEDLALTTDLTNLDDLLTFNRDFGDNAVIVDEFVLATAFFDNNGQDLVTSTDEATAFLVNESAAVDDDDTATDDKTLVRQVFIDRVTAPFSLPNLQIGALHGDEALAAKATSVDAEDAAAFFADQTGLAAESFFLIEREDAVAPTVLATIESRFNRDGTSTYIIGDQTVILREASAEAVDLLATAEDLGVVNKVVTLGEQADFLIPQEDAVLTERYAVDVEDPYLITDQESLAAESFFLVNVLEVTNSQDEATIPQTIYQVVEESQQVLTDFLITQREAFADSPVFSLNTASDLGLINKVIYIDAKANSALLPNFDPLNPISGDILELVAIFDRNVTDNAVIADSFSVSVNVSSFDSIQEIGFYSDFLVITKETLVGSPNFDDLAADLDQFTLARIANQLDSEGDAVIIDDETIITTVRAIEEDDQVGIFDAQTFELSLTVPEFIDFLIPDEFVTVGTDRSLFPESASPSEDLVLIEKETTIGLIGAGAGEDGSSVVRVILEELIPILDESTSQDSFGLGLFGIEIELTITGESGMPATLVREVDELAIEEIWNEALTIVGQPCVTSISDGSSEAETIACIWDNFRCEFIGDHTWNGAVTVRTLSRKTNDAGQEVTAPREWNYVYELPSDYCRAWRVNGDLAGPVEGVHWQVKTLEIDGLYTRVLLANTSTVDLEYIFDVGNQVTLLTAQTRSAMAHALAVKIAPKMGLSESEIQGLNQRASVKIAEAKGSDGQEGTPIQFPDTRLLDARNGIRTGGYGSR